MTKLIAIGHYSRTGKDTLANYIIAACREIEKPVDEPEKFGFSYIKKYSYAYKLKAACHVIYGWAGLREPEFYETKEGERLRDVPLPGIGLTPVEVWIDAGNKLREVYADTWVRPTFHEIQEEKPDAAIITDTRFPNEIFLSDEWPDRLLIKTVRPGVVPRNSYSDQALLDYTGWDIYAGPTLDALRQLAWHIAAWLVDGGPRPVQSTEEQEYLKSLEVSHGSVQ